MKSDPFRLFLESIKSPGSKEVYTYSLHEFMRYARIKDYDSIVKLKSDGSQQLLKSWIIYLKKKNVKAKTIKSKLNAVERFLDANEIDINTRRLHKLLPSDDTIAGGDVPFTTEDIQKMLVATTKLRTKAVIHFVANTGMRPGALIDPVLRQKHLQDMPNGCKAIMVYDNSKEGYWAFLNPEASKALEDYLKSRKLNGEEITPESPLFANYEKKVYGKKNDYISAKSVRQIISQVIKAAGIERKKIGNRFDKAPVYGFRKRFNTILKLDNQVNSNIAEKLMGHKRGLDGSYFKPTREQCFAEFVKAVLELTISDQERDKLKIAKLEKEKSEIDKLKSQVSDIRKELETEVKIRAALVAYHEHGDATELDKIEPEVLEAWGYWNPLIDTLKVPKTFVTPKERLLEIAKDYPPLAKAIGKNGENLVTMGKSLVIKNNTPQ